MNTISDQINLFATQEFFDLLCNLKFRWDDEKDYEDFNDYIKVIKDKYPEIIKVTKRPFGIVRKFNDIPYQLYLKVTGNNISLKARLS